MASPVNDVDMTASASTPGVSASTRGPSPTSSTEVRLNPTSSSTGMTIVSRNCSPWRSMIRSSIPACAATIRHRGAAPGAGANGEAPPSARRAADGAGAVVLEVCSLMIRAVPGR
ncbi:hypothetical protein SAMN05421803_11448 [Nocardiopsis flavescens]|uniref:Uncharacterized protein n=1 Tax=Nocardiopsis flavescens TaxID=758803 RepID=A0A1M6Q084_9ACTN|nr:hypothetical protein SAMN05421803_11448 [Nocardiopsis flavescens]